MDAWGPTPGEPIVLNLPATVEMSTPNVYADQIEWIDRNLRDRASVVLSVHPHNDRGTAVAAAELARDGGRRPRRGDAVRQRRAHRQRRRRHARAQPVLARRRSAARSLERAGDRAHRRGVQPPAGASRAIRTAASSSSRRSPARTRTRSRKASPRSRRRDGARWEVPYLAIDPKDIGRTYDAVVRVNSQSGKGGVAYMLGAEHGFDLPRGLQVDFSRVIQARAEASGGEIAPDEIRDAFESAYVRPGRLRLAEYQTTNDGVAGTPCTIDAVLTDGAVARTVYGDGTGPIDAFVDGLRARSASTCTCATTTSTRCAPARTRRRSRTSSWRSTGDVRWGVGIDPNIVTASLAAIVSAVGRTVTTLATRRGRTTACRARCLTKSGTRTSSRSCRAATRWCSWTSSSRTRSPRRPARSRSRKSSATSSTTRERIVAMIDHVAPAKDSATALQAQTVRTWAKRQGIRFHDIGDNGICHVIVPGARLRRRRG